MTAAEPPIACQLHALDAGGRRRQKELLEKLRSVVLKTEERSDGFEFQLPSDRAVFLELAEWVGLERVCCPFAAFAIEWRRDDTLWVRITGGAGAKEVLAAEMQAHFLLRAIRKVSLGKIRRPS